MALNRRIVFIGLPFVIVVAIVAFLIISSVNKYHLSSPIANNIQFPYYNSGKLKFFTGSSFAEIIPETGKTKSISPIVILPEVTQMKWSDNGVIFSSSDYTPVDDLYKILTSSKLPTDKNYWWYYDLENKKISVLVDPEFGRPAIDAVFNNEGSIVYFTKQAGDEKFNADFFKRDPKGNQTKILDYSSDSTIERIVNASKSKIDILTSSENRLNLIRYSIPDGEDLVLAEDINREVAVDPTGTQLIISKVNDKQTSDGDFIKYSDLYLINGDSKNKFISGFIGFSEWDDNKKIFVTSGQDSKGNSVIFLNNKDSKTKIDLGKQKDLQAIESVNIGKDISNLFITDENKKLMILTQDEINQLPEAQDESPINGDFYEETFNLNYLPKSDSYNVYITENPFSKNSQKALDFINSKGIDANQIPIKWYFYDNVNRGS